MTALFHADRVRLVKLLGLLGSNFAGERDAAGLAAVRLLRERGLQWSDVVAAPNVSAPGHCRPGDWRGDIERCVRNFARLSKWERDFVVSLRGFRQPSLKQTAVLRDIAAKVQASEQAA